MKSLEVESSVKPQSVKDPGLGALLYKAPRRLWSYPRRLIESQLIKGTDLAREVYRMPKRLLNHKEISRRRRLAEEYAAKASFKIPKDKGFEVFPPEQFSEVDEIVQSSRALGQEVAASLERGEAWSANKAQLKTDLLDPNTLTLASPYLRFALRPDILGSVIEYLGVVPILADINVWYSRYTGNDAGNSQLFHCDWDDSSQMKIFIYSTEVTEAHGPLVVMDAKTSEYVRSKLSYKYVNRVTDEEMSRWVDFKNLYTVTCEAGTVAFADTSRCFHYGSRVTDPTTSRVLAIFQYLTPSAFLLTRNYRKQIPYKRLITPDLPLLERLVLGGK